MWKNYNETKIKGEFNMKPIVSETITYERRISFDYRIIQK